MKKDNKKVLDSLANRRLATAMMNKITGGFDGGGGDDGRIVGGGGDDGKVVGGGGDDGKIIGGGGDDGRTIIP